MLALQLSKLTATELSGSFRSYLGVGKVARIAVTDCAFFYGQKMSTKKVKSAFGTRILPAQTGTVL